MGVLAGSAGLTAKAGRDPGVAARQLGSVEDLVGVKRGQRHLGGTDQKEPVALDLVDHLALSGKVAGAVKRALSHQHRWHHRLEPLGAHGLDREADQRQLDHDEIAEQIGKARARRRRGLLDLDPAMHRAELDMVANVEVELTRLADLAQGDGIVLPTLWRLRIGKVGKRHGELVATPLDLAELGLHLLELSRDRLHLLDHRGGVAAGALGGGDLIGGLVLAGAASLDLGQQLAAAGVEGQQLVEGLGGAAARERGAGRARVLADRPQIQHDGMTVATSRMPTTRPSGSSGGRPRCLRTRRRTRRSARPHLRRRCSGA